MPFAPSTFDPAALSHLAGAAWAHGGILAAVLVIAVCLAAERLVPAGAVRPSGRGLNLGVCAALISVSVAGDGTVGALATLAINGTGGGWIVLPSHGWGLVAGCAAYFVVMDFGEYLFHRAQHAIPALWAMHSLHHSDPSFNITTTQRHFWLEPLIKTVTIWLAVGLLFKASPMIVSVYAIIKLYNFSEHSDVKVDYGWFDWLLASPLYHRTHHSSAPEHFDCNFAALLPIFDVLSGAYRRPDLERIAVTGLDTGEHPRSMSRRCSGPCAALWAHAGPSEFRDRPNCRCDKPRSFRFHVRGVQINYRRSLLRPLKKRNCSNEETGALPGRLRRDRHGRLVRVGAPALASSHLASSPLASSPLALIRRTDLDLDGPADLSAGPLPFLSRAPLEIAARNC
jgi:sterol desaturase/sphingolipid hydroxylase (fatty acid hydroxylase superfamily)